MRAGLLACALAAALAVAAGAAEPPRVIGPVAVTGTSVPLGAAAVPGAAGSVDLAAHGYVEEEFFVSGRASAYDYDEGFAVVIAGRDLPYTTRLLVRRPADAARFSGVVHLESAHPLMLGSATWRAAHPYFLRSGHAYVLLVTGEDALTRGAPVAPERAALVARVREAQAGPIGAIELLRWFDPQRYAALEWPEDDAPRWDALLQVGALLKSNAATSPLRGMRVERLYASGWSFTGSLLRTFINEGFHDRARLPDGSPVFDGYLIGISSSSFISGMVSLRTGGRVLPVDHPRRVTRAIDVPVIELMSENEAVTNTGPQAAEHDSGIGRHRLYEVPGLSHGDGLGEPGVESTLQYQLRRKGYRDRPRTAACDIAPSDVPLGDLAASALENLHAWVSRGLAPPRAARLRIDSASGLPARDELGNALGGVRTAQLDVPLARYGAPDPPHAAACAGSSPFLIIGRHPLSPDALQAHYGSRAEYLARFEQRLKALVADRWLLPHDAVRQLEQARALSAAAFATARD